MADHRLRVPSRFGPVTLVWQDRPRFRVLRILLPGSPILAPPSSVLNPQPSLLPGSASGSPVHSSLGTRNSQLTSLVSGLARFLRGEPVKFSVRVLALDQCPDFQRRVLLAEHRVPRGRVTTYARLAARIGSPGAARAVGRALATNPFPLIIPCHRAIHTDRSLGGFQGGVAMKRALLEMEGVRFAPGGRVLPDRPFFPAAV